MLRSPTRLKFKDCKTAQKLSVGSSRGHQLLPPKSEMLQTVNIVKYCRLICGGWSGCLQPSVSQLFLPVCETKVGCWLQLAVTVLDWYLSHRHRAAQVVDQVVYQTSIRREWTDPVLLCMCQSILVQDAESQFAPDIHRSVCVWRKTGLFTMIITPSTTLSPLLPQTLYFIFLPFELIFKFNEIHIFLKFKVPDACYEQYESSCWIKS